MTHNSNSFAGTIVRWSLIACSLVGIVGCSSSSSMSPGTGGSGSGGTVGSGGLVGTGGTTTGTGGATTGTGGATSGTGGTTTGAGGVTTGAGGKTTGAGGGTAVGGNSGTGVGGATTSGQGGATGAAQGGASGSTGVRGDGGPLAGRGGGGSTGPGGSTGGGGNTGVPTVDGGGATSGPSAGCGKNTTKPSRTTQQTIDIAGTTRYYLLNLPSNYDNKNAYPLVFALHGYDMNNIALVDQYDFTKQSGNKAITVMPQGEGPAPGNTSHWGDGVLKSTWTANDANYSLMQNLKAFVEDNYCIDTGRVFFSGFSMGGMFTNSMACDHDDWFRGYAPVEGGGPGTCSHADAKPAIIIHQGTADTIATPEKGGEPTRDFWTKQNGCQTTTTSMYTGCLSYNGCEEPVLYCTGNWDHYVNGTALANIWKFFDSLK